MRVLLAFDKFKDSLTAHEACAVTASAVTAIQPSWQVDTAPLADGGEGFAEILTRAAGGELHSARVMGPRIATVDAKFGLVGSEHVPRAALAMLGLSAETPTRIGVVEMAAASGLALLAADDRDVWHTTTLGTGELMQAAVAAGAQTIVLGVGGSATNDVGLGALAALGVKCQSEGAESIRPPVPATWTHVARLSGKATGLPPIFIACDVTNPLLGPKGAAAVYGPQKGLRASEIGRLDYETARMALLLCSHFGQPDTLMDAPGTGAAGGIAFGLMAAAGAKLVPGFEFVSQWLDLEAKIAAADIVITGEGRFDESSLTGKGPGAIAARAAALGKVVHVFAGSVATHPTSSGIVAHAITPAGTDLSRALAEARINLTRVVTQTFQQQDTGS